MLTPAETRFTLILMAVLIAAAPLFFPSAFYYRIGALIFINAFAVTGLVVLIGYAGQISLGHAGFSGVGAYACALAPGHLGLPPVLALVLGALVSGALAWVIGRPILRLRGHYLAAATLGFGVLVYMVLNNAAGLTGGPDGVAVPGLGLKELLKSAGLKIKTPVLWYWLSGAVLTAGALAAAGLHNSPTGRALRAVHDSETAAAAAGVDVARCKLAAFVISAVYASVAGSMIALFNQFISPGVAGFLHSIELVTMAVLGGAGAVFGAFTGAAILTAVPQALAVFHDLEHLLLGLTMILVMIFMRDGLVPGAARFFRRE